jgi:hypothetical protein
MNKLPFLVLCTLLAGCTSVDEPSNAAGDERRGWTDSQPLRATYDLAMGIDQSWLLEVADPPGDSGSARFTVAGPSGAPIRMPDVCFAYSYEQWAAGRLHSAEGRKGNCAGAVSVAPEASIEEEVLFDLSGSELLAGGYSFRLTGGPQAASLTVELVPR